MLLILCFAVFIALVILFIEAVKNILRKAADRRRSR